MAELAVTAALSSVQIVLTFFQIARSSNHRRDLQNEIVELKRWLKAIKAFIEDHDGSEGSSTLQNQMEDIRDVAYDIEDVLDEIVLHSPPYTFHNHEITRQLHNIAHNLYHGFPLQGISDKIATIKEKIEDIKSQRKTFRDSYPGPSSSSRTRVQHRVSPLLLDDEMVGYEEPKKKFIHRLVDGQKGLVRLAVVGPGGSGKTTFVKNVFWKRGIRGRFDCHAWVHVSQHFNVEELFINMLKQFCYSRKEPYPIDDSLSPLAKLQNYLAGKKFVLVLDDIWRKEHWDDIKAAFPNAFGCRIVVTTTSSTVASVCASSSDLVYSLNGLEWLEGWKLFCRNAFPDSNGECPSELKDSSVKIVKRCEGLPFAIVAVGGVLAQKARLPNEWERFHNSLGYEIGSGSKLSVISNVLLPGYMDLSSNLKSCFLYFSIFPEDYSVKRGRLIRLWVAERFATARDEKTAEEIAEDYLDELIQRNLVHVSNWDFDGRPRSIRVLNLVLKFIIQKCKDENFTSIFRRANTCQSQKIRRLSIHNDCTHLPQNSDFQGVRSMFLLGLIESSLPDFERILRKSKLQKVLDLQEAPLAEFPEDITNLTLLRYLSLRDTKITKIPSSIKKLSYLETLDLRQTDITELPKEISYLHNLCHLFAYKYNVINFVVFDSVRGVKIPGEIGTLTNLQDLSLVIVDAKGRILEHLKKLSQLRKLGLTGLLAKHVEALSASVEQMKNIRTLDLCSASKAEYLEVRALENPPHTLQRLYLKGRLGELPRWISSLNNLLRIGLKWSKMKKSPLPALAPLPNLVQLQLVDCYIGEELIFEAECFKKLKNLEIEEFSTLHTIVIQHGAMPDLKEISLRKCPELRMFPLGIHNLAKIEELTLYDMAKEFIARLRRNGEDREMVSHIPVIHSFTLKNRSWSLENLSDSFSSRSSRNSVFQ
ncbi:disease resistance protein RPM1-like [Sesamum indicum]|uniref:Disease resistance protein RPM1-like n=1 Tax=Sesamum indicum TaxID=4182 RepID=A0A6I9UCU0_SESIN|nr:disease resistance protein RPM1-like [Sesamum indicum]